MELFPAICVDAVLAAFGALGLDVERIRSAADLPSATSISDQASLTVLPTPVWGRLWAAAREQAPQPELAVEAGLAVPLGAFGTIDYLAGSAESLGGAMAALRDHLTSIDSSVRFRLDHVDPEVRPVPPEPRAARFEIVAARGPCGSLEQFVLATLIARFRDLSAGRFELLSVAFTAIAPDSPSRHSALLGAPVEFAARIGSLDFEPSSLASPLRTADPRLHGILRSLASQLSLSAGAHTSDLELAIRGRLRDLMRGRDVSAAAVARSLGMSERTLHRRLGELGRRYQDVVDTCRETEAERLLLGGDKNLLDVALALGFSDQSAFNRAFRRWKKLAPTEWRAGRLAAAQRA